MCGIAGIINKIPRTFDYSAFCVMGIANDSRGGDSCGVFIDGKYEYGVDKQKLFSVYFQESDLLSETQKSTVALLHCRKASVGKISKETAQPVVLTDSMGNVQFVVLHNGTIYNYEELAKKWIPDIDINGMTDSQVMARIFYYTGYEVLNEYNGGAVFAIVDYRGYAPKTLLFKGASKKYKYSKEEEEERPLFYCIDKMRRELVFSSIGLHLLALRKDCDTYVMKPNVLLEFNGKALTPVKTFSRENACQTKETPVVRTTTNMFGGYGGYYGRDYCWEDDECGGFVYDNYLSVMLTDNIYRYHGKKAHGRYYITRWGKVETKPTRNTYDVWFFGGILLKNVNCFRFLSTLKKESKLCDADFSKKFENVIRFLSIDEVYPKNGMWYKTISPTGSALFSGIFQPIGVTTTTEFCSGLRKGPSYSGSYETADEKLTKKHDINFKSVKEECKSLMK